MKNYTITQEEKKTFEIPNLNFIKTQKNLITELQYYSFEERTFDLSELFKSKINKEMSTIIGSNVYCGVAKNYIGKGVNANHLIFNGVYKLAPIDEYIGIIPENNQIEIKQKFESLKSNPFLKQKFELVILAPLNNFSSDSNINAIDPICFAYFKDGENCYEKNYLITLSQWV
jgi:hypothetical protein